MPLIEGARLARKYFQDALRSRASNSKDGNNRNRAQSQLAADGRIYADVSMCILTAQPPTRAQTLSRDSGIVIQLGAQPGARLATPCPAKHDPPLTQGDGSTTGTGNDLCLFNDLVQESVEVHIV